MARSLLDNTRLPAWTERNSNHPLCSKNRTTQDDECPLEVEGGSGGGTHGVAADVDGVTGVHDKPGTSAQRKGPREVLTANFRGGTKSGNANVERCRIFVQS